MADTHRDWPILLAQRMRESAWINAQVALVGHVECRTPDPLCVMNVGGRYQLTDRDVRRARAALSPRERAGVAAYLLREDEMVLCTDEDGRRYYRARPPEMLAEEALAFRHLWHALADAGHVERRPPRPPKPDPAPTPDTPEDP